MNTRSAIWWSVLAVVVAEVAYLQYLAGNRHEFFDLEIYRQALSWWLGGNDLYAFSQANATQGQLGFTYPPFGALVLLPFALLPDSGAIALFVIITLAAIALTTYWLVRPIAERLQWPVAFVLVLTLAVVSMLEPVRETFCFGQINILLIAMILADLLILAAKRSKWTGTLIGIAAAIKLTPAIFIIYLFATGRMRAAMTAIAAGAAMTIIAAAIAPHASWAFWRHTLWSGAGIGNAAYTSNQSIYGALARLFAPDQPSRTLWIVLVIVALAAGFWRAREAAAVGDEVAGLTLAGLTGCLISPITWIHHLYWFVPAALLLVALAASQEVSAVRRLLAAGFAALIVATVTIRLVWWSKLPIVENWYLALVVVLLLTLPYAKAIKVGEHSSRI